MARSKISFSLEISDFFDLWALWVISTLIGVSFLARVGAAIRKCDQGGVIWNR